ncbi:MAG: glycosyltransferase [Bacteroidetes bacterium]|nr:glycosyltransferase [Bacteroidota bacterium]
MFSFKDERLKYFKTTKKGNANVCRNIGLRESKGQYIAMLDSDDEWLPDHLEKKIDFIESKKVDGVFGSYRIDDGIDVIPVISRDFLKGENMANYILSGGKAATPTHVYKASFAKEILWDENLFRHQDYDFSIRFAEKFKFVPSKEITCIVHWSKNEKRVEHFESQQLFIKKHQSKISPQNYNKYHYGIYNNIKTREDIESAIKKHYSREQVRYIHALSFLDYSGIMNPSGNKMYSIYLRVIYALRVFFKV